MCAEMAAESAAASYAPSLTGKANTGFLGSTPAKWTQVKGGPLGLLELITQGEGANAPLP